MFNSSMSALLTVEVDGQPYHVYVQRVSRGTHHSLQAGFIEEYQIRLVAQPDGMHWWRFFYALYTVAQGYFDAVLPVVISPQGFQSVFANVPFIDCYWNTQPELTAPSIDTDPCTHVPRCAITRDTHLAHVLTAAIDTEMLTGTPPPFFA